MTDRRLGLCEGCSSSDRSVGMEMCVSCRARETIEDLECVNKGLVAENASHCAAINRLQELVVYWVDRWRKQEQVNYRGYTIERTDPCPPIPYRGWDWEWAHTESKDDGPDCEAWGHAGSVEDCIKAIEEHLEDEPNEP